MGPVPYFGRHITFGGIIPVLGIDVGTSGSRAIVVAADGRTLAAATVEHLPFDSPQAGWAEQHPDDWWRATQQAIRAVLSTSGVSPDAIVAIGLSGQMHGAVLLDAAGEVVRPAIIWCDQRTEAQTDWLRSSIGLDRILQFTSNPPLTNFTLTKLLWVRQHEPALWSRVRHVLLPKDYVRFRLSGQYATDVSDASGTLMFDVARRRWSAEMVQAAGLNSAILPRAFESPEICANISTEAAEATGLRKGTPIAAGAGDQAAGAVGMGITRPGSVSVTIGTSGVVFAATDQPALDPQGRLHTFCHAIPDRWHLMGVTQAAGLSLRWWRDQLRESPDDRGYEALTAEASTAPVGSDGVLWVPYLMGERTPHLDPNVRAAVLGLSAAHTRAHIARAVLEGVAFSLRDSLSIFSDLGVPIRQLRLGGGGARSALWRQIQADVYGHPVDTVAAPEGAAFGAALLAGVGAGLWSAVDPACDELVRPAGITTPRPEDAAVLDQRYDQYRRAYSALKAVFQMIPSPVGV